jgi:flagellar basal-body rod modification protein FlgD
MDVTGIGTTIDNTTAPKAAINQEDFLKVLLAQLQFQDPLKPLDNNQFIAQFAQLTSLEQTQQLNDKMDSLLALQNGGQALDLIGHSVETTTPNGNLVGQVTAISFQNGTPSMTVQTQTGEVIADISLGQIQTIR